MTVHLVGAGPGDPDLITVRGAELLKVAEVVIHDRLTAAGLLELTPDSCERLDVGKDPDGQSVPQGRINELLVEHGLADRIVVRLKGGDPYLFARGAEEAAALAAAGVDYEVVPGISSAFAAPAYGGIPVTRRYSSTSVTVVTGHEDPSKHTPEVDWDAIARLRGTIVILMGVRRWPGISQRLRAGGLPGDTPAAAVHWGSTNRQRTVRATLATLGEESLRAPSVIVLGEVVRSELDWFEQRPLFGRRVVITRASEQRGQFASMVEKAGAEVLSVPTIAIADPVDAGEGLRSAAEHIGTYDWVVLSSPNGAQRFLGQFRDARSLAGVRIAVVGPGTSDTSSALGVVPDLIPARHVGEGLIEEFPDGPGRVLLPRAAVARDVIPDGLVAKGWEVEVVEAYRTVPAEIDHSRRGLIQSSDAICFTSSSSVDNFVAAFGAEAVPDAVAAIGPITAAAAESHGLRVTATADPHSLDGLLDALIKAVGHP